jgi:hypothetical protein
LMVLLLTATYENAVARGTLQVPEAQTTAVASEIASFWTALI